MSDLVRRMRDPLHLAAGALIAVSVVWRYSIARGGFLAYDDFPMATRATEQPFSLGQAFATFNDHLMPAPMAFTWLVTRDGGHDYGPYLAFMTVAQAVLGVAFTVLLRRLVDARWGILLPLAVLLFSPLTLEATSWWAVGANLMPMQLAMVLALLALLGYARHRRVRDLVAVGLAMVFGLLFFEKALLVAPLLFLFTACLLVGGRAWHSVVQTVRRYWQVWAVVTVTALAYLALYLSRATSSPPGPKDAGEVVNFVIDMLGATLLPGLIGGPWQWFRDGTGDGTPITAATPAARWLATLFFVALAVATIQLRRSAVRAWVLLLSYAATVAVLLSITRLGMGYSGAAGLAARYVCDIVLVAALCLGVAMFGLRPDLHAVAQSGQSGQADRAEWPQAWRQVLGNRLVPAVTLAVTLVALIASASVSFAEFRDDWRDKAGRDFIAGVRASLREAPPGTVFLDRPVPAVVIGPLADPYHLQSRFFAASKDVRPVFVSQARRPMMLDDDGRIQPVVIEGVRSVPHPTDPTCGYTTSGGRTARVPLTGPVVEWDWTMRIAYLSTTAATAVVRFGDEVHRIPIDQGLSEFYFPVSAGGSEVELTVAEPGAALCTNEISVGVAKPFRP